MKVIYGLKMIDLEDIMSNFNVGRPSGICNYLKNDIEENPDIINEFDNKLIIDTSLGGENTIHNILKPYKLIFIPLDIVEEKIISSGIINYLKGTMGSFLNLRRISKIEKTIEDYNDRYLSVCEKYKNTDKILNSTCCMLIFEGDDFLDVRTVTPSILLKEVIFKKEAYVCSICKKNIIVDNTSMEDFIPDMNYETNEKKEIFYFCKKCCKDRPNAKQVGN